MRSRIPDFQGSTGLWACDESISLLSHNHAIIAPDADSVARSCGFSGLMSHLESQRASMMARLLQGSGIKN
jgi:hypothetical protein